MKATTKDSYLSSEDDEEIALMTNNFRKFLKYRKGQKKCEKEFIKSA